jgi:hypothetical protein
MASSTLLEQDFISVPGQIYALISIVGPDCPQKNDKFGLKIRGVFPNKEEAASHAKRLQKEDGVFDIYVVDMYKWLLIPPDRDHIDDVHYSDEKLEEIMKKYQANQQEASALFEKRRRVVDPTDENSKYYNKPDEPPISHPSEVVERLRKEKPDAPLEDLVKEAHDIIEAEMEERRNSRTNNVTIIAEGEEECSPPS